MHEDRFKRMEAMAAIAAYTYQFEPLYMPTFDFFDYGWQSRRAYAPSPRRRKRADPVKKAARKRQKAARAKTRKARR